MDFDLVLELISQLDLPSLEKFVIDTRDSFETVEEVRWWSQ